MQTLSSIIESGATFINIAMAYLNDQLENGVMEDPDIVDEENKVTFDDMLESVDSDEEEESVRMDHLLEQHFNYLANEAKAEADEVIQ